MDINKQNIIHLATSDHNNLKYFLITAGNAFLSENQFVEDSLKWIWFKLFDQT